MTSDGDRAEGRSFIAGGFGLAKRIFTLQTVFSDLTVRCFQMRNTAVLKHIIHHRLVIESFVLCRDDAMSRRMLTRNIHRF